MALREKISEDMKTAMKSGDKIRLETIRSIRALILEFDKSGANRELTPEDEIAMLSTAVKKRRESVEMFTKAGRMDLAGKESAELNILQEYLPKQLSEDELIEEIKNIALQVNASTKADFAKLMPAAMKQFKGKAEGKIVKSLVEKFLGIS
ncbi:MAG: glutamyl-tRNA amidotransferase [Ignavibacteria bacterium CG_4_8_14_3_um_filter_37_9]|nr:GatB/YqeY domain-containing protein [Ignavibacteria bacterium]OIO17008.1 MAG: glutamyl-tRNA amidotransferase [Ignavibacteria bacterium CG1_02_37_35]PIS45105.1 MAG: glutamyl-tRNA amidotransferase [Ignavibacteria bacterium CG08_land_8_20_14_0_20_37_9]PIW99823.1 MAG: glutamyl-tRNA amidotransferase [Ignavibacteria bacterium CG_4_8_14_3_um_filter_37_9]PIX95424.1 MAG: glutamyl-tRNA amidotransferase [Ignavibacteria bacterium CG_4_10_14_3_um_filter_37_18]PJC60802.1 MAG: glutamyl-tRNA amidotransfera